MSEPELFVFMGLGPQSLGLYDEFSLSLCLLFYYKLSSFSDKACTRVCGSCSLFVKERKDFSHCLLHVLIT